MVLTPYLNFAGKCEEAFKFYEQALGGTILAMMSHAGTPAAEFVGAENEHLIMHACLKVGDSMLMASDFAPGEAQTPQGFAVSIHIEDPEEADRVFAALSEGADVRMPIQETFWALRFGMLTDRFGTPWMINCQKTDCLAEA